ncbi:DUF4373 domain-containing protein [Tetragenococcus halophilus]|nr:DUF4373 domain-containing protein [Tetragenococcus halophilus]
MARPTKEGIEYFSFDVDFFSDIKVKKILRACGAKGIAVLVNLLCNIYRDHGYYMQWDDEIGFLVSDEVGANESIADEVVQKAVQVGFFDKELFDKYQILTSKGIQTRYLKATYQRKDNAINEDYNLIQNDSKKESHEKSSNSYEKHANNPVNHSESTQSKVKESKGNKSKVSSSEQPGDESVLTSVQSFQQLWNFPNMVQQNTLMEFIDLYGDGLVDAAIKVAGSKDVNKSKSIAFIESCLKEWSDANVKTIEQAREYQRTRNTRNSGKSYQRQPTRKEELPIWAKDDYEQSQEEEDPTVQKEINQKLQDYLKRKESEAK